MIISKKFYIEGSVQNGSISLLRSVCYTVDKYGKQHMKSCVVYLLKSSTEAVAGLREQEDSILDKTNNWMTTNRKKSSSFKDTSFNTACLHDNMILHTGSETQVSGSCCWSYEASYVMLSHAKP